MNAETIRSCPAPRGRTHRRCVHWLLVCFTVFSTLPDSVRAGPIYGAGNEACSGWLDNRAFGNGWQPAQQWVLGYLSGLSDTIHSQAQATNPEALISYIDDYCRDNPSANMAAAARSLSRPPGISVAGPGSSEAELGDAAEMNRICRNTYPNRTEGAFPIRWASTDDYLEYSRSRGWGNAMPPLDEQEVALRAERTRFTQSNRAFDQATGAISQPSGQPFPAAVILRGEFALFSGRKRSVKPLCVFGPPNPQLR